MIEHVYSYRHRELAASINKKIDELAHDLINGRGIEKVSEIVGMAAGLRIAIEISEGIDRGNSNARNFGA